VIEKIVLSLEEDVLLEEHYKKSETTLIRSRAHAVLLNNSGYHAPEISHILRCDEGTVRSWIYAFSETRIASIFPAYTENTNASKLTKRQLKQIKKTLGKPPSDEELPGIFWSVKGMKSYLTAKYGVVYESDRSYHHLFAVSKFSFKFPEGFDRRRNDVLVQGRMKDVQKEMREFRRDGYLLFAADECSLAWETTFHKAWVKEGEKTIVRMNREKTRRHYFGALNLASHKHELIPLTWQNTETIIGALRELTRRYPSQRLCILWDNAAWHRAKALRDLLGEGHEFAHIRLVWLPPYAPDENPEEHVWKVGKEAVSNRSTETFDEMAALFEDSIQGKEFGYQICGI
jgi:transposase